MTPLGVLPTLLTPPVGIDMTLSIYWRLRNSVLAPPSQIPILPLPPAPGVRDKEGLSRIGELYLVRPPLHQQL